MVMGAGFSDDAIPIGFCLMEESMQVRTRDLSLGFSYLDLCSTKNTYVLCIQYNYIYFV